ncbi:MAG: ABC transporter substrate-binding protein [Faecalibacterium sp.]
MKKITRRNFLALTAATGAALALTACSEETTTTTTDTTTADTTTDTTSDAAADAVEYKVGIVNWVDHASLNQIVSSIEGQLDALAAASGGACTFNYADFAANANADATTLNQIGADLLADDVDAIVAIASPVAAVMQTVIEDTDVPVIYAAVSDPETSGLTGNPMITGASDALNTDAIMNLILATVPAATTIGLLYDLSQDSSLQAIADAKAYCDANGLSYVEKNGTTTGEVMLAAETLVAAGVDAIFTPSDNTVMTAELSIYETFIDAGVPHFGGADSFALNGAFCGYGVDYAQLGVAVGDILAQVLVDGVAPADIPYMTFDNGLATVNTETCDALGYDLEEIKTAFDPYCTEFLETVTDIEFE